MSGILDLLQSDLGSTIISGIANSTNTNKEKTSQVLTMGMPVLMKAMQRNAQTDSGSQGLLNAITGKHDGSILDNLGGLLGGSGMDSLSQDGGKILGHVLGSKQGGVQNIISQKVGIDSGSVSQILKIAAPILMGFLGKQGKSSGLSNASDVTGLLGGLLSGGTKNSNEGLLEQILDADGDGSMVDDVAGMLLGGSKKSGGLGGMLGGLLGGK